MHKYVHNGTVYLEGVLQNDNKYQMVRWLNVSRKQQQVVCSIPSTHTLV